MLISNENIKKLHSLLQNAFKNTIVMEYSGWNNMVNPFDIVEGAPEAIAFAKEFGGNVCNNSFSSIDLVTLGNETFIRLVSNEHEDYDCDIKKNSVIRTGMEILVNMFDRQVVIIDKVSPLKRMLRKYEDINPFTVFLFSDKERLEDLAEYC